MIDLVFGVHLYQPPNQKQGILRKITEESYLPLIKAVLSHDKALLWLTPELIIPFFL